jgi:uncharacterized protein (TIGR02271 family)
MYLSLWSVAFGLQRLCPHPMRFDRCIAQSGHCACDAVRSHIGITSTFFSTVKTPRSVPQQQSQADPPGSTMRRPDTTQAATVIPVMQEELDVRTRRVETDSGVRVSKAIEEREEVVDEALAREEVEVERVPMNVPVEAATGVRYEGDTMVIPIFEEVVVVEKRLMLKEEIRVTRRRSSFRSPQRVTLRREVPTVERIEAGRPRPLEGSEPVARASNGDSLLQERREQQEELRRNLGTPLRDE